MKATTDSIKADLYTHEIKSWLDPPDPSTNANHARKLHHEGTGAWLLEDPVFRSWYSGSRRHIWLHGLAGCGKTILTTTVLDYLAKGNDGPILNFFFDFSDTKKQTYESMLRSFAFQLYQGGVNSAIHLDASFQAHQNGKDQPKTEALWAIFYKMLEVQGVHLLTLESRAHRTQWQLGWTLFLVPESSPWWTRAALTLSYEK